MSKKFKISISVLGLTNAICGFIIFFILPTVIMVALNRTHGIANNSDGEATAPIGWLILVLISFLTIALCAVNIHHINKAGLSRYFLLLFFSLFLVGAFIAFFIINMIYSYNYWDLIGFRIAIT